MEIKKLVQNPLTLIAIFAALTDAICTVVLPFLKDQTQLTFIWFVMLYPSAIVVFFFLTLNFNNRVLYSPSDFKDEKYFVDLISASRVSKSRTLPVESQNEVTAPVALPQASQAKATGMSGKSNSDLERQALLAYSKSKKRTYSSNFTIRLGSHKFGLDGFYYGDDEIEVVEVKFLQSLNLGVIRDQFEKFEKLKGTLAREEASRLKITFIIIGSEAILAESVKLLFRMSSLKGEITYEIVYFRREELITE
jgi:hypothetical protein